LQALLPLIPDGASSINDRISVIRENGRWAYFLGVAPIFDHPEEDRRSFRMFTAGLVCQGSCKQSEIVRTFRVSVNSVKRSVKKYREEGIASFFQPRKGRGATVLTDEVLAQAQGLLSCGSSRSEVAVQLGVRYDTLRKAINQGRLREPAGSATPDVPQKASDKSERSLADASAEMGVACTRPEERVLAAMGTLQGAPTRFEDGRDVSFGGVLCALPALLGNGLFEHLEKTFPSLGGYYTTLQVVTLLAYMALCRIKTVEQLQYETPGELGKLLGLDRIPEVRCLRKKLTRLSQDNAPEEWAGLLSRQWLRADSEHAGVLYVDGHVRLYHGKQTELPRRYVSRQRLCLRGTTDYWVNDALGLPFFCVERPIDHGMLEALRSDIVPRLLQDVPRQPSPEELEADPRRSRFVIIFDREGYSPAFFKEMWQTHRISCITYHKHPKEAWPDEEFSETKVTLPRGQSVVSMKLAERGSWIGDKKNGLWVREVRKLTKSGHQVSLISSVYGQLAREDAAGLFSRWSQENFFRYMMQHYAIDLLSEYRTEEIPGTNRPVVNPRWRELDSRFRSLKGKLQRQRAEFAAHALHPETDEDAMLEWERCKSELVEAVEHLEHELIEVKQQRKETPHHLEWDELPVDDKFERLAPSRKRLTDTVKLIAYRAETALATIMREALARQDDARSLLRDLFRVEADLSVDTKSGVLTIGVHPMANPRSNRAIDHLLGQLNAAEMSYPGTNLKLAYTLLGVSSS
jgi:prepilin-type processing-associated H-X9-DG protein